MNTVITHFYNEEYLLPWWINHHKKLFDHGIMINHHSTDRSVEICKELCPPNWKIVDSCNYNFDATKCDNEVKEYESSIDGFKIALTLTEFLLTPYSLNELNEYIIKEKKTRCIKTIGILMLDIEPNNFPSHDISLITQKHHGMIRGYSNRIVDELDHYTWVYGRFYHNLSFGNYSPGRHLIHDNYLDVSNVFTLKYKYSPWNKNLVKRMTQIGEKIPQSDIDRNMGKLHLSSEDDITNDYNHYFTTAYDLKTDPEFLAAYNYCVNL
jgi:hypothetical protein